MNGQYGRDVERTRGADERLARGLGWFSIGLGLAEIAIPGTLAQLIGVRRNGNTQSALQAYGVREIANGMAILQSSQDPTWLWTRVGGDALDIATLAAALNDRRSDRQRVLTAIGAVAGITAADIYCARQLGRGRHGAGWRQLASARERRREAGAILFRKVFTINRQPDVVYGFWRTLENLPRFMKHLESVHVIDATHSRWRAKAPAGMTIEWDAEIIDDQPNERIAWRSIEGARVPNRGTVRFRPAPGARGTELDVEIDYTAPGGRLGSLAAKLFGEEPAQQVDDDLRRLKQVLETGEIARSGGSAGWRQPAQPAPEAVRRQMAAEGVRR
jgi:uncharacterized membrane protein